MILPEHLEGYDLSLRRWRPGDEALLHRAVVESTEHLRPWMDWVGQEPLTIEQRRTMLEDWERRWLAGGDVNYAVLEDGVVAGGCGFLRIGGPETLEIGYWTHPAHLRRGVATRAARLLTDTAFSIPGIESVKIHHDQENRASRGVPQGLGFELIDESPDSRAAPAEVGIDCTWRMTRAAWLRRS